MITLIGKLFIDLLIEGLHIQIVIFLVMIIFDLFAVLPAIIYYTIIKKMNIKKVLLMY